MTPEPGSRASRCRPRSSADDFTHTADDFHIKALDAFCDRSVWSFQCADPVQSKYRGDLCSALAAGVGRRSDSASYGHCCSLSRGARSVVRLGHLGFECDLHPRTSRDNGRVLDGYRGLAFRVPAGHPARLCGRRSRLVLSASGSAEIRAATNARLARHTASGDRDRRPEHHALSSRSARLVQLKADLRFGYGERRGNPLLLINEWFHPLPLLKLQMLGPRNLAYGVL